MFVAVDFAAWVLVLATEVVVGLVLEAVSSRTRLLVELDRTVLVFQLEVGLLLDESGLHLLFGSHSDFVALIELLVAHKVL